jgi:hypothetical protein
MPASASRARLPSLREARQRAIVIVAPGRGETRCEGQDRGSTPPNLTTVKAVSRVRSSPFLLGHEAVGPGVSPEQRYRPRAEQLCRAEPAGDLR